MRKSQGAFYLGLVLSVGSYGTALAETSAEVAAATAEVYILGRESQHEDLLQEISDPETYDEMAAAREADSGKAVNENVRVDEVEITEMTGDRAVATARYGKIHGRKKEAAKVHLKRVDGQWQVTTPPKAEE